jgi:hypothetical protein
MLDPSTATARLIADAQAARVENDIADKLTALAGVSSVGFARSVAMDGIDAGWNNIPIEGKDERPDEATIDS